MFKWRDYVFTIIIPFDTRRSSPWYTLESQERDVKETFEFWQDFLFRIVFLYKGRVSPHHILSEDIDKILCYYYYSRVQNLFERYVVRKEIY